VSGINASAIRLRNFGNCEVSQDQKSISKSLFSMITNESGSGTSCAKGNLEMNTNSVAADKLAAAMERTETQL